LPDAIPHPAQDVRALAAQFEAAWAAKGVLFKGDSTDDEANAAVARVREVAQKIVALPATDLAMMRLKARVYLWSESTDFATFAAENEGNGSPIVRSSRVLPARRRPDDPPQPIAAPSSRPAHWPRCQQLPKQASRHAWKRSRSSKLSLPPGRRRTAGFWKRMRPTVRPLNGPAARFPKRSLRPKATAAKTCGPMAPTADECCGLSSSPATRMEIKTWTNWP
jgi:hypothetical protein